MTNIMIGSAHLTAPAQTIIIVTMFETWQMYVQVHTALLAYNKVCSREQQVHQVTNKTAKQDC